MIPLLYTWSFGIVLVAALFGLCTWEAWAGHSVFLAACELLRSEYAG